MDLEACYTLFDALQLIKNTSMCVICLEMVQDPVFTRCQHMFCRVCITRILNSSTKVAHCPLCNTLLTKRNLVKNEHISKQIECAHRLIDSITEDLPMELSYFERPPHSTKEALTPVPYSGKPVVCNTTMNNSTNIEFDKNKLDYSTDDLVNNISPEIMSRDKTNFPDKLTATKTTSLCPTGTPRFGKSYGVRKPSLNSAGKLPESDKSSSLSVDAESVRTLDLNLPTVNKSNSIANWLSSQTNSVCRVVVNKIDNLYPGVNISSSTSLNSVKTDTINENNNLSSSLTKNKCISTLKHFTKDESNFAMKLKDEPNKRDLETIDDSLLQKRTVPKGIFDVESKNDSQVHNTFNTFKSKRQSDNDYQSDGINGEKEDPFIFISSQRTPRRVRYRKDGVKIIGKTRALRPDKKAIKQKEAGSDTIPRVIADEAQNVNVDFVENCPVNINDSFDQMVQDYKSRGNAQKQDGEISESGDESDDCLNYLFKSLEGGSYKFPRRVIVPTSDESDGQSSLSDTRHASLTSIKENTSTATQNKPLIKFWYLSSLRCDKDEKFLSCMSHLTCNECSPLGHRNCHSFPCNPKETCDEECQATVAKLDVGTQSESHLTSKTKRTPIYVETGVQTCVPNKSFGNVDKLDPTSPTCSEIDPANLTRTTTTKNPQETSTKSTCCENTKLLTFASIEKQIQNNNVKNTIVESTDIEFVPETEDNHCTDSEIFSESLAEVMSGDHPNDGKPLSKCSSLHLEPLVGLQRKQNGTSTLPNDSSNSTRIINRSPVNMFAGENKSNIHVNFEDMPTQKQSSNANNKHLSSLSDVSTVLLSTGEVNKYIKEPEIYSKKKKKISVLESGSHLTHNKQMPGKSNCENKGISDYEVNNTAHSTANKAKAVRHLTFSQNVIPKLTDPSSSIFTEENTTPGKTKSKKVTKRARRISTSSDSGGEIRHEARKRKIPKENIPVENETLSPRYKNDHYFENDILSFDSDAMDEDEFMRRAVENCEVSNSLSILPPDAPKNKSTSTGATDGCDVNTSVPGDVKLSTQDGPQQSGRRNNQVLPNVSLTSSLQALLEPESRIDAESTQPHTIEFLEGSQKDDAEVCRTVEHDVHTNSDQDISSLGPESYLLDTQQQHDMEVRRDIKTRLNLDSRCKQSPTPSKQSSNTLNPQQTTDVPTSCWKRPTTIDYQPMAGNVKQSTNPRPANIRTPSLPTELCVACSGLTLQDKQKVVHFADFFKLSFSNSYESRITHLVVPKVVENLRTIKFLFGIAEKKWIVYLDWVTDSIAANTLLPEVRILQTFVFRSFMETATTPALMVDKLATDSTADDGKIGERYEALGNDVGPRLSRQTNTPLFQQFEFYFDSLSSGTIDKAQIENLVTTCGATVVPHPIKFNLYSGKICMIIIETREEDDDLTRAIELYNEFKAPSFYLDFIIESIAQFAIADCYDYVTLPITKEDFRKFGYPV
uniref:(California timema) hypothetical protein n=1 Tax=Timema californicum TaxID=61474 RepID=A0A7R9JBQ5_TIMCA|nr:unnamed protein product [Timema californicum]